MWLRTLQVLGAYGYRGKYEKKAYFIESIPYAMGNLREILETPFDRYPYLDSVLRRLSTRPGSLPEICLCGHLSAFSEGLSGHGRAGLLEAVPGRGLLSGRL